MQTTDRWSGRHGVYHAVAAACLLVAGLVLLGLGLADSTDADSTAAGPTESAAPTTTTPSRSAGPGSARPELPATEKQKEQSDARHRAANSRPRAIATADLRPRAIAIPRIGVRAGELESLALAANGEIEVPEDADNPGWYTPGPAPGQIGPAVIAGHLDDQSGPAVFYRLSELRSGDRVRVTPRRGPVKVFTIDRVVSFEKDAFPTKAVYGPTIRPELRLITCGGRYAESDGYTRNTVAFAHLV